MHADLRVILADNPQNTNAQILDALTLQQLGQPKEALNQLNLIVSANPQNTDALSTRAAVEAELKMYAMARADYDALIALEPQESAYYVERAKMLINLGEKRAARNDIDRAIKLGIPHGMVQPLIQQTRWFFLEKKEVNISTFPIYPTFPIPRTAIINYKLYIINYT